MLITRLFSLTLIAASIFVGIYSLLNKTAARWLFVNSSYYLLLILFFYWVILIFRSLRDAKINIRSFIKKFGLGIFVCWILTASIFISVKPYYRVLADEATLMGVSQSMTYERKSDLAVAGVNYAYAFRPLEKIIPRRPLLFPFFTHIVHSLLGYDTNNGFVLNFISLAVLFCLVFIFFNNALGPPWGYAAVFLAASQPLLIETATSSGFDLFALTFMFICFLSVKHFLEKPSDQSFLLLWVNLLMLAHIRYESPIFFILTLGLLFVMKKVRWDYFRSSQLFTWTPLLLLPILWSRMLAETPYSELEVGFSVSYFIKNTLIFLKYLTPFHLPPPTAVGLNLLGIAGLILCITGFVSNKWATTEANRKTAWIMAVWLDCLFLIIASYFFGDLTAPACTRFYVVYFFVFSLLAVLVLHRFSFLVKRPIYILALCFTIFLNYHTLSLEKGYTNWLDLPRRYRYALSFFEELGHNNFLVFSNNPVHYTIRNWGALNFHKASLFQDQILRDYKEGLYESVFTVEQINIKTGEPQQVTAFDEGIDYERITVFEIRYSHEDILRISRVKRPTAEFSSQS